jgi:hypothetical protein
MTALLRQRNKFLDNPPVLAGFGACSRCLVST